MEHVLFVGDGHPDVALGGLGSVGVAHRHGEYAVHAGGVRFAASLQAVLQDDHEDLVRAVLVPRVEGGGPRQARRAVGGRDGGDACLRPGVEDAVETLQKALNGGAVKTRVRLTK